MKGAQARINCTSCCSQPPKFSCTGTVVRDERDKEKADPLSLAGTGFKCDKVAKSFKINSK